MNDVQVSKSWTEKCENYIVDACNAEMKENFVEAERLFRLALFCDGKARPDVMIARDYVNQAGPVYPQNGYIKHESDNGLPQTV